MPERLALRRGIRYISYRTSMRALPSIASAPTTWFEKGHPWIKDRDELVDSRYCVVEKDT